MMAALSVLSVAVAKGRAGYVYMVGGNLKDWGVSVKAATSSANMVAWVQGLINRLRPGVVVTEKFAEHSRKRGKSRPLVSAAARLASHNYVLDVSVERPRKHRCKYTEAQALARAHPELLGWVPRKRRYWDSEPGNTILFETLALAEVVIKGSPMQLARAMG